MTNMLQQRADELIGQAREHWSSLRKRETVKQEVAAEAPPARSHAEELRWELSGWANQAPAAFMDHIESYILQHNAAARHVHVNHADTAFELGCEHSLRVLRNEFIYWQGQSATADPEEELPNG